MMYWNRRIQAAKIGYLAMSILLCALGCILIAVPDFSLVLFCRLVGILMILFGFIKIIGYCSRDLYRLAFQYDLALGLLLMALGVLFIVRVNAIIPIICTILGICVFIDALLKIQISIDSKAFGISLWWLILSAAVVTGAAGFMLILRPWESAKVVMILLGIALITEGLLNLITVLAVVKLIRRQQPTIIDTEYREIRNDL